MESPSVLKINFTVNKRIYDDCNHDEANQVDYLSLLKTITVLNKRIHDECDHDVLHYWLQPRKDTGLCTYVLQLMMSMEHVNKVIFPIEVLQPA